MRPRVGLLTIELLLPGASSLKEKRSRLRPVLEEMRRRFPVSAAEVGRQDDWDRAVLAAAVVGVDTALLDRVLAQVAEAVEKHDVRVENFSTEVI